MFEVRVADNFHYRDEDEIYTHGRFETWPDAVAAASRPLDIPITSTPSASKNSRSRMSLDIGSSPLASSASSVCACSSRDSTARSSACSAETCGGKLTVTNC